MKLILLSTSETSDCPRMLPTPPPCPFTPPTTAMATEAEATTAQPTTEEPTTPDPTTEEPTTSAETLPDPTTEEPISSDSIATNMASSTTDSTPGEVVDDRVGGGGGAPVSVIAAVVLAILVVIVLTILISVLVAVALSKKRGKIFNVTHTNMSLGIANKLYGNKLLWLNILLVISLFFWCIQ